MNVGKVLGVVDKVLSNRRVQGALGVPPQPPTCGQDQRLDVLIAEVRELNRSIDQLIELQAAALQLAVDQVRPVSTMELLPEPSPVIEQMDAVLAMEPDRKKRK